MQVMEGARVGWDGRGKGAEREVGGLGGWGVGVGVGSGGETTQLQVPPGC